MAGVILENISTKKMVVICLFLFSCSLASFILGGTKVPASVHTQTVGGNWCVKNSSAEWYPSRGPGHCHHYDSNKDHSVSADDIIFSFQYPLPRDGQELTMSKWFMYHVTVLSFEIPYDKENNPVNGADLALYVTVGYSDGGSWKVLLNETVKRKLTCTLPEEGHNWDCEFMDLFEIGNMHHERYLVNIGMPPDLKKKINTNIGSVKEMNLVWFAQTGGFTLYFLVMKTVCFAMVLPLTIWNWKRVSDLNRPFTFLEKLLLAVALSAISLNFPIDWLVLVTEMKFMLLWSDIRQGVFLSVLLSYWLVFTGEHQVDNVKRGSWSSYWKQLALVIAASSLMFIFDICERGMRLSNPFFSLWSTPQGTAVGKTFIGLAIAAGIIYFLVLTATVIKAIYNIWTKRSKVKTMARNLRIHYMTIVYRFVFSLSFTAVCSLLTIVAFAMGQIYESQWKWDLDDEFDDEDEFEEIPDDYGDFEGSKDSSSYIRKSMKGFEINSAFQLGVYVTWNVYVMAMLIFYAPSHKSTALNVSVVGEENDEQMELTAMSSTNSTRNRTSAAASIDQTDELTDETVNLTTGQRVTPAQVHTLSAVAAASVES